MAFLTTCPAASYCQLQLNTQLRVTAASRGQREANAQQLAGYITTACVASLFFKFVLNSSERLLIGSERVALLVASSTDAASLGTTSKLRLNAPSASFLSASVFCAAEVIY